MEHEIKGSVWNMLSSRCQLDIKVEISSGLLNVPNRPSMERSELKI